MDSASAEAGSATLEDVDPLGVEEATVPGAVHHHRAAAARVVDDRADDPKRDRALDPLQGDRVADHDPVKGGEVLRDEDCSRLRQASVEREVGQGGAPVLVHGDITRRIQRQEQDASLVAVAVFAPTPGQVAEPHRDNPGAGERPLDLEAHVLPHREGLAAGAERPAGGDEQVAREAAIEPASDRLLVAVDHPAGLDHQGDSPGQRRDREAAAPGVADQAVGGQPARDAARPLGERPEQPRGQRRGRGDG